MKAVRFSRFGGPEVLEVVDLPDPHPGPGQVRIAVRAAGVTSSDVKKRKGLMDRELPQTMGYEAAGVVDELGEKALRTWPSAIESSACPLTGRPRPKGRAVHSLGEIGELVESGRFTLQVAQTFPLADIARAHSLSENGHAPGKLVLLVG